VSTDELSITGALDTTSVAPQPLRHVSTATTTARRDVEVPNGSTMTPLKVWPLVR
jgi:hypothetical protein